MGGRDGFVDFGSSRVPDLCFDDALSVLEENRLSSVFDADCGLGRLWDYVFGEPDEEAGFANARVPNEDDLRYIPN